MQCISRMLGIRINLKNDSVKYLTEFLISSHHKYY